MQGGRRRWHTIDFSFDLPIQLPLMRAPQRNGGRRHMHNSN
jgi:hypothetical protein